MADKLTGTFWNEEVYAKHDNQHAPLGVNGGLEIVRVSVA
jgi:hypothetical protein